MKETTYVLGEPVEHTPGKTFEMEYTVSGIYTYDILNGIITSYGDATLNIDTFLAGAKFGYELKNIHTSATLNSGKTSVTFRAGFSLDLISYMLEVTGFELWRENFGPYAKSVTDTV